MLAADGRCKTFDAAADGYVRGEGCGVVVLKRLTDARADGDRILAVIRGTAVNQDGRSNGLTAPNGPAQEDVIRQALEAADVAPDEIDYVEAHGTGTSLGDPIEVGALARRARRRTARAPLAIGSVKTNIGHLEAAAGIAGLIKTVLALERGEIPASLHFTTPNPFIPWTSLPVDGADAARGVAGDEPAAARRRQLVRIHRHQRARDRRGGAAAGRGAGGRRSRRARARAVGERRRGAGEDQARLPRRRWMAGLERPALPDICHTANAGRSHFDCRLAVVGSTSKRCAPRSATRGRRSSTSASRRASRGCSPGRARSTSAWGARCSTRSRCFARRSSAWTRSSAPSAANRCCR